MLFYKRSTIRMPFRYTFYCSNNYYRLINGYPPIETKPEDYHYITSKIADSYGIDKSIPIHKLQDYYNLQKEGEGDRIINLIDGLGIIKQLKKNFPEEEYLNYIGSERIDIIKARKAKNFEILKLNRVTIKNNIFDAFIDMYDKCREYFCCTIFNSLQASRAVVTSIAIISGKEYPLYLTFSAAFAYL